MSADAIGQAPAPTVPDARSFTPAEEELRRLVRIVEPGILLWQGPPTPTVESHRVMFARLAELAAPFERFAIIADGRAAGSETPQLRLEAARLAMLMPNRVHIALLIKWNSFIYYNAKFLMARLRIKASSIHRDYEPALAACRTVLVALGGSGAAAKVGALGGDAAAPRDAE